jgi:hypothetical protein
MPGPLFPLSPTRERAWIFALLVVPMAVISSGLVNGGLSFLLTRQGVGMAQSSGIISLLTLPMAIYFLWSPLTDFFVERKTWSCSAQRLPVRPWSLRSIGPASLPPPPSPFSS